MSSAFAASTLQAAGIVALKEQTFHSDASANVFVFKEMLDDGSAPFVKFETGREVKTIDRPRITAVLSLPSSIPLSIADETQIEPLRKSLKEITAFSSRFPKSEKILEASIGSLSAHIAKFDEGQRRINGKWLTAQEIASGQENDKNAEQPNAPEHGKVSDTAGTAQRALPTNITIDGEKFEVVKWNVVSPVKATFTHKGGVKSILLASLSADFQDQLGYSPQAAAEYEAAINHDIQKRKKQADEVEMARQNAKKQEEYRAGIEFERARASLREESAAGNAQFQEKLRQRKSLQAEIRSIGDELAALRGERFSLDWVVNQQRTTGKRPPEANRRDSLVRQIEGKERFLSTKKDQLRNLN